MPLDSWFNFFHQVQHAILQLEDYSQAIDIITIRQGYIIKTFTQQMIKYYYKNYYEYLS